MPDVWATVSQLDAANQERLAEVLETRGADPQQQAMRRAFLAEIAREAGRRPAQRRLPSLVRGCGLEPASFRSHGFVGIEGGYMLTIVDRGADMLHAAGQLGDDAAAALKTEARRRVAAGTFFGYIAYASLTARKPS
jgi:hypothetical protein